MTYLETPVTYQFRISVLENFKILQEQENTHLFRLLDHILFGAFYDDETLKLLMGSECLKTLRFGRTTKTKNFKAEHFTNQFSEKIFRIVLAEHSWIEGKAKVLESASIPPWLECELQLLHSSSSESRNIGFVTGEVLCPEKRESARLAESASCSRFVKGAAVREVLDYLNGLDSTIFRIPHRRWDDAFRVAHAIRHQGKRESQLRTLRLARFDTKPVYKAVERSSRIYTIGPSFLGLNRQVRHEVTKAWVKIDLKNAQLNIVSKLWAAPEIRSYLDGCRSGFWKDVADHVEVDFTDSCKGAIKDGTYALLFGAGWRTANAALAEGLSPGQAKRFREHPLIAALVDFRDAQGSRLRLGAELCDAFGNAYSLGTTVSKKAQSAQIRSVLACQAQSYELPILYPVVQYAQSTQSSSSPLVVMGWLHDGIWVDCENKADLAGHVNNVEELIRAESAKILGFAIEPDIEFPEPSVDVVKAA